LPQKKTESVAKTILEEYIKSPKCPTRLKKKITMDRHIQDLSAGLMPEGLFVDPMVLNLLFWTVFGTVSEVVKKQALRFAEKREEKKARDFIPELVQSAQQQLEKICTEKGVALPLTQEEVKQLVDFVLGVLDKNSKTLLGRAIRLV